MDIYIDYENKYKNEDKRLEKSVDMLQNEVYFENPITPIHMDYYHSKYKNGHNWMIILLILSIVFYTIHFIGFYLILNSLGVEVLKNAFVRTLLVIIMLLLCSVSLSYIRRYLHKWNWKTPTIIFALIIGIIFSLLLFTKTNYELEMKNPTTLEIEPVLMFLNALFNAMGMSFGPASLIVFISYKSHSSITDYGGIHLFLGWIYRISETNGNLKVLNSSYHHLIYEIDNWLNETSKISIKNKYEILEGFYLNLMSNEKFLENISKKYRDSFNNIFTGLLGEEILDSIDSKVFSQIEEKDKKISHLKDKADLKYIKYRLALTQIPKIINLIETLSSKKVEILYYSTSEKLKKIKLKIIPFVIFMITTIIPLILSLFP